MIIDITVRNFTSIKEEQLFSMNVERDKTILSNNFVNATDKLGILKTAGLLGSNASGKSNLLKAFEALRYISIRSDRLGDGDAIPCYEPFLLSESTKNEQVEFEIEFILNSIVFRYLIKFDKYNIYHEELYFVPNVKPAKLFRRTDPTDWKTKDGISFGDYYKNGKQKFSYYSNNSFLSKAGNSPESPQIIQDVYKYLKNRWNFVANDNSIYIHKWQDDSDSLEAIKSLMCNMDLGIDNFRFNKKEIDKDISSQLEDLPEEMKDRILEGLSTEVIFSHTNESGKPIEFKPKQESLGTKRLFQMLPLVLLTLKNGDVLFIDEIEDSYHLHVVELIIKLFHDPKVNINNSQLIYTTHNVSIMKSKLIRKDQLWLVGKFNGATEYRSLDDFDSTLRSNSPFDKWYEEGRLGGIPSINYYQIANNISKLVKGE